MTQLDRIEAGIKLLGLRVDLLTSTVNSITIREQIMSVEMDQLVAAVETETTVDQSVLTFLQGISQQIQDAAGDRAKSLQLAATVKSNSDRVAAALVASTPAANV